MAAAAAQAPEKGKAYPVKGAPSPKTVSKQVFSDFASI